MTWINQINNSMIITLGDGKKFTPEWLNATKQVEYNFAQFEFPNLTGSLVKRGTPMGRKFSLEIYFQGENHLETADAFEKSAADKRPWQIDHPFYGLIIVQPTSLMFDNTGLNISKITGTCIETIVEDNPKTSVDAIDLITIGKTTTDENMALALTSTPSATDVSTMSLKNERAFNLSVPIITIPEEFEEYTNIFNQANSAINTASATPLLIMRTTIAALSYPSKLTASVKSRTNVLTSTFNDLRNNLGLNTSVPSKQIYQNLGGAAVSSICIAVATPLVGDYTNRTNVVETIESVVEIYNQYFEDLDTLQSDNGGNTTSFVPDAAAIISLNNLFNATIANLFAIALNSKSERTLINEKDTNIIILTHRFYGLDVFDNNIDEMVLNNNLGLNDLLLIKKGKKIVYYI